MGVIRRLIIGVVLVATGVTVLAVRPADAYLPANHQSFLLESGTVASVEAPNSSGTHQQFGVACPVTTDPAFIGDGSTSTCSNGQITILVSPTTKFYSQQSDGLYHASTYEGTLTQGGTLRVGGKYARENSNNYQLYATYVWNPGTGISDPPANPFPSTVQDFNYARRFVVDATVVEPGMALTWAGPWSTAYGFVAGHIPSPDGYYKNEHLQRIAANHRDPLTLDPQLKITTDPATKFYVERCNPTCKFYASSKDEAVNPDPVTGQQAQVRAAGSYAWSPEGDWRLIATYVWRPSPVGAVGRILFGEQSTLSGSTSMSASTDASYDGLVSTGTQLNPGSIKLATTWSLDEQTATWLVTGTWRATRTDGLGTASGSFSGSWKASTGALNASAVMDTGTGRFGGYTGGGIFTGVNVGPNSGPTQTLNGDFNLAVAQS
jgi:hypothetical protein